MLRTQTPARAKNSDVLETRSQHYDSRMLPVQVLCSLPVALFKLCETHWMAQCRIIYNSGPSLQAEDAHGGDETLVRLGSSSDPGSASSTSEA